VSVRTTLTLDDDVDSALRREARRTGKPLKTVVNDAIRAGLQPRAQPRRRFTIVARDLGLREELEVDDVEGLLDRLEGPDRR
jgi:hypothetical protein